MEEKVLILKMLEEGKINTEEALRLLDSLEKNKKQGPGHFNRDITSKRLNETINEISKRAEKFAEKFGPDFISKVENVSNDFADAAVKFADKMVGYINSGIRNIEKYNTITKTYSFPITNDNISIRLNSQNIRITVDRTNLQDVTMKLVLNLFDDEVDIENYIKFETTDDLISFVTRFPVNVWGKLDISIPENINEFTVDTTNSKCRFEDIHTSVLKVLTTNGKIEFEKCNIGKLSAKTNNGKIQIEKTFASSASIATSNSGIEIRDSSFDSLNSLTSNNYISLNKITSIEAGEAQFFTETTNGRIIIVLPDSEDTAYKINAATSVGNVNMANLESSYIIEENDDNMQKETIITANNYDSSEKRILISASTTNSSVNISKE